MTKAIDSSVWKEYLDGNKSVRGLIESEQLITSTMAIAELSTKYEERKQPFDKVLAFILSRSKIVSQDIEISLLAAKIKVQQRKKKNKFGLADAIHYATAVIEGAQFITFDNDFKGMDDVIVLKK